MSTEPDDNVFHKHLDVCSRCRNHPFNLCPAGNVALLQAATGLSPSAPAPKPR